MTEFKKKITDAVEKNSSLTGQVTQSDEVQKGPMSFLSGSITSGLFAWLCLELSKRIVAYFTIHPPVYSSPIAQSIATGFKTLVVGVCFLATFTFGFIGLGLALVFIRSLFDAKNSDPA